MKNIKAELPDWPVSDDTVLHLATAEGLATGEFRNVGEPIWLLPVSFAYCVSNKKLIGLI